MILASAFSNENDRRILIAAFIIVIILFILIGLIGMLIRKIMQKQAKRLDDLVADAVRFRIVADEKHFRRYAKIRSKRLFYKQAFPPMMILFSSLVIYLIYAGVTDNWSRNYFGEFGDLFFLWDFGDEGSYVDFWGMHLLAKWPPLTNEPHFEVSHIISYILCLMWLIGIVYFFVVSQAYLSRAFMISHRASTVYNKSLDGFNYYESIYPTNGAANPYTGIDLNTGRPIDSNQNNLTK